MRAKLRKKKFPLMNKRGDLTDYFFITVSVFVAAIFLVVMGFLAIKLHQGMAPVVEDISNNRTEITEALSNVFVPLPAIFDKVLIFLLLGLGIGMFILLLRLEVHPVFAIIFLFVGGMILLMVAANLSNVYEGIRDAEDLLNTTAQYPVTNFVFDNYPTFILLFLALGTIVLYAKPRQQT